MSNFPVNSDGYLELEIFDLSSIRVTRHMIAVRRCIAGMLGGFALVLGSLIAIIVLPASTPWDGVVVAISMLGAFTFLIAAGYHTHLKNVSSRHPAEAAYSMPEETLDAFVDWADRRYDLKLDRPIASTLLGVGDHGNTHDVDGDEIMLGTPKRMRPAFRFGLIVVDTGEELRFRQHHPTRAE